MSCLYLPQDVSPSTHQQASQQLADLGLEPLISKMGLSRDDVSATWLRAPVPSMALVQIFTQITQLRDKNPDIHARRMLDLLRRELHGSYLMQRPIPAIDARAVSGQWKIEPQSVELQTIRGTVDALWEVSLSCFVASDVEDGLQLVRRHLEYAQAVYGQHGVRLKIVQIAIVEPPAGMEGTWSTDVECAETGSFSDSCFQQLLTQ